MAFGIEVYNTDSTKLFDITDKGFSLIDTFIAPAGVTKVMTYTNWVGYTLMAVAQSKRTGGGHLMSVSGNVVTATQFTISDIWTHRNTDSLILVFAR